MTEAKYIGRGKSIGKNGLKISICLEDIPEESKQVGKNGKTYVNAVIFPKPEVDQWGNTHTVKIDDYKPKV